MNLQPPGFVHKSKEGRMQSTASRLRWELSTIAQRLANLIQELPVKQRRDVPGVISFFPDYHWDEPSAGQIKMQIEIKRDYEEWFEVFKAVFVGAPDDLSRRIEEADQLLRTWIELGENYSIEPDSTSNERKLWAEAERFIRILEITEADGTSPPILIPDTNAIVGSPDPTRYRTITNGDTFTFMLLPTVLSELDVLKNHHRNADFRDKAKKAISRIKGWRRQGSLRNGVTVDRTITVRAVANEPDMQNTLKWLDKENRDDRIVASVIEAQSANPTARVMLVTGDINLMNKADVARIETAELDGA